MKPIERKCRPGSTYVQLDGYTDANVGAKAAET